MISLTAAEINAWVVAFFFPLARILAVLARLHHSTIRP
jgi:flagellar biosynthesis protein FliR